MLEVDFYDTVDDKAYLDASLPAAALYEKLGFSTIKHERYLVENGVIFAYEVMEKELNKASTDICYDGRRFIPKMNSENGKVNEQTIFTYHQKGKLLWAEYSGGNIFKGFLIGTVSINLEATDMGRPLYEKYGFVKMEDEMELQKISIK